MKIALSPYVLELQLTLQMHVKALVHVLHQTHANMQYAMDCLPMILKYVVEMENVLHLEFASVVLDIVEANVNILPSNAYQAIY
jgi:hypothetical protein